MIAVRAIESMVVGKKMNETNPARLPDGHGSRVTKISRTNRFDPDLYARLAAQASKENRTISNLLETAAIEYMRRRSAFE
jgi:hypothetical protein